MPDETLREALEHIEARLQSARDGNGVRPWSEDYLRDIIRECRDKARDALDAAAMPTETH